MAISKLSEGGCFRTAGPKGRSQVLAMDMPSRFKFKGTVSMFSLIAFVDGLGFSFSAFQWVDRGLNLMLFLVC